MVTIAKNITFVDSVSGIRPPDCSKLTKIPKNDNDVIIFRHQVVVKLFWRCLVSLVMFSYCHVNIITGSRIMPIFFIRDWPKIRKSEIHPSEICRTSRDWGKLWISKLARMSLIECYWMLQNDRVTTFIVFELLRENQLDG